MRRAIPDLESLPPFCSSAIPSDPRPLRPRFSIQYLHGTCAARSSCGTCLAARPRRPCLPGTPVVPDRACQPPRRIYGTVLYGGEYYISTPYNTAPTGLRTVQSTMEVPVIFFK